MCMHTSKYRSMFVCVCMYVYVCVYVCMYVCVCVFMYAGEKLT